jgi:hypothetical protein
MAIMGFKAAYSTVVKGIGIAPNALGRASCLITFVYLKDKTYV